MSYTTIVFLFFLLATGVLYFSVPKKIQWGVLLAASMFFYILSCGVKTAFLLAAATVIYIGALIIQTIEDKFAIRKKELEKNQRKELRKKAERKKKIIAAASIILMILMIFSTKYFNFFGSIINQAMSASGIGHPIPVLKILMPLGISYYTLMGISYITDVYRKTITAERNPLMLLLFLCYFPHIIEGPFDRYAPLSNQFRQSHRPDYDRIKNGGIRLVWGLFKKFVIADRAGLIVNTVFSHEDMYSGSVFIIAILLYTLQIYTEFSGCMDMVCGTSQIFGITISENFKRPFFSRSINEFWRRWHITLGEWLKDYVFYPVSLSGHFKKINEKIRKHINSKYLLALIPSAYALFFVWFCNGLWHGASIKYIFYGLYYYILMMMGQAAKPLSDKCLAKLHVSRNSHGYHIFEVIRTCIIVCFGMMIFRSGSLSQACSVFTGIFTNFNISQIFSGALMVKGIHIWDYFILAISFMLLLTISYLQEKGMNIRETLSKQIIPIRWTIYIILLFSIIIFGAYGGNFANTTFIYGEF